jgi:hypothetical protein
VKIIYSIIIMSDHFCDYGNRIKCKLCSNVVLCCCTKSVVTDVCRTCNKEFVTRLFGPCQGCKEYRQVLNHECLDSIKSEVKEIRYDVQKLFKVLKELVEHLDYQPGGKGFHKAKSHFEEASKDSLAL